MKITALLASSLLSLPVLAANYTLPQGFDLNQVDPTDRAAWCLGERNACPKICGGAASVNKCDPSTLDFTCTCTNGSDANVVPYMETIPFYVCQENYAQCIRGSGTQEGDEACKEGLGECGSLNASATTTSLSSTTASLPTETSGSSSGSDDNSNDSDQSETTSPSATGTAENSTPTDAAVSLMQNHGVAVFATVMIVAFGLL